MLIVVIPRRQTFSAWYLFAGIFLGNCPRQKLHSMASTWCLC